MITSPIPKQDSHQIDSTSNRSCFTNHAFFRWKSFLKAHCIGLCLFVTVILLTTSISANRIRVFLHSFRFHQNDNYHFPTSINIQEEQQQQQKINVWQPDLQCTGSFVSKEIVFEKERNFSVPYAMIRDSSFDNTASIRYSNSTYNSIYISVFISLHVSVVLQQPEHSSTSVGKIEMIEQLEPFLNSGEKYKAGVTTKRGDYVNEWRVLISMQSDEFKSMSNLKLSLPLKTHSGRIIQFYPWMRLSCVTGYDKDLTHYLGDANSCLDANNAVSLGGKGIYGDESENHFKRLALFTARSLLGPIRFSAVVMPINVPYSQSEINSNKNSAKTLKLKNQEYMNKAASIVEQELKQLGLWEQIPNNALTLIPTCTLGTDASRNEKCSLSSKHGQYQIGSLVHSIFSQFFKWSFSSDIDEFLYDENTNIRQVSKIFDNIAMKENEYSFSIRWFNILVKSNDQIWITKDLIEKKKLYMIGRKKQQLSKYQCMYQNINLRNGKKADVAGKPVLRCDVGEGFKVHSMSIRDESNGHINFKVKIIKNTLLRTWHARDRSPGSCKYQPNYD